MGFLAVAVVIAIVAVVLLSSGGDDDEPETTGATATATPAATDTPAAEGTVEETETATPTPTATPRPEPPLLQTGKVTKLRFDEGDTVRFRVASPSDEEIHVHGYDVTKQIPASKPTNVSFPADITGIFEIEFHGSGEQIGQLRVDPD
jgi:FtsP/CotA-like multicopper oxidase with cupredoxin domain